MGKIRRAMSNRLIELCCDGNSAQVERLMLEDCDVACSCNVALPDGTTPMLAGIIWGHPEVVKVLLKCGADVNAKSEGTHWTPLHAAALQEHAVLCAILLDSGADPLAEDSYQRRPVDYASVAPEVWPHFEAKGCTRTSKEDLVAKSVIKKVVELPEDNILSSPASTTQQSIPGGAPPRAAATKPSYKPSFNFTVGGMSVKPKPKPTIEEYSRPGSAYVKRDGAGALPPPPPTRAGRSLAHGMATRKVRDGPGSRGSTRAAATMNQGMSVVGSSARESALQTSNFNMMVID